MSQLAVAFGAGLWLISIARGQPPVSPESVVVGAPPLTIAPVASAETNASPETAEPCSEEEAVCRETRGFTLRLDRAMSAVTPSTRSNAECSSQETKSVLSTAFDRSRSDTETMCVADAI